MTDIFSLFHQKKIEILLIKGWVCSQNYPPGISRIYVDFDICVKPEQFSEARFVLDEIKSDSLVDLHCGLRHLDSIEWDNLYENSVLAGNENDAIRVLRPEDHLRVLCVHWLTDGGAYRERLWDIYYAVANRPPDFDWSRFLDVVEMPRRQWLIDVLLLTERYLSLDLTDTPLENKKRNFPGWLIREIEREWSVETRLQPLVLARRRPRQIWQQIRKRLPPNAVHATVSNEGQFDEGSRLKYQIRNIFQRI